MTPQQVNEILAALVQEDLEYREKLLREGRLSDDYDPEMERIHIENARRLQDLVTQIGGWPTEELYGVDAEEAAWLIAQHAISLPDFQRWTLQTLRSLPNPSQRRLQRMAMLEDRIRLFQGGAQFYGTHFDWSDSGEMVPQPIEDKAGVDQRRAHIGLESLQERLKRIRQTAELPPKNPEEKRRKFEAWLKRTGWRS